MKKIRAAIVGYGNIGKYTLQALNAAPDFEVAGAHQAPPSLGFSRQEHWSGLPFPSPMHEREKWKWSHSVLSDSYWPHGLQPTRLLHPWDFPGKSSGVGCHCLLCLSCLTPCNPMECSTWGFSVHDQLLELAQTHVHRVSDAILPSHPLLSPSPPAFHPSQYQGLFQLVGAPHQLAKVLELQPQHQSFQRIFRADFL